MGRERALLDTIARAGSPAAAPNLTGSVMNADELCVKRCELVRHISVTFAKQDTRVGAGYRCEEIPVCDEWLGE